MSTTEETYIAVVDDTFQITGRGCVLTFRMRDFPPALTLRAGDRLAVYPPAGDRIETSIRGVEFGRSDRSDFVGLLVGLELDKSAVPIGSKLHWMAAAPSA